MSKQNRYAVQVNLRNMIIVAVAGLAAIGSLTFQATPTQAESFQGLNGKIAFDVARGGAPNIYTVNANGSNEIQLTTGSIDDDFYQNPSWSPDGSKILYDYQDDNVYVEIYIMNPNGSNKTKLTNSSPSTGASLEPSWSPDGSKIAYSLVENYDDDGTGDIMTMNTDGSGQVLLTSGVGDDREPSWSPDGSKIAFESDRSGNREIYIMNTDGSGVTNLTNDASGDREPSWSPDGSKIAFESDRSGNREIYIMNTDGSGQVNLTNGTADNRAATWSPDGSKIAFISRPIGEVGHDIYTMNVDGSMASAVTSDDKVYFGTSLAWQPLTLSPNLRNDTAKRSGNSVTINVLSNDVDPYGSINPRTVTITSQGSSGVARANRNGTITYTNNAALTANDQFTYRACSSANSTLCATATVLVNYAPAPPVASTPNAPNTGAPRNNLAIETILFMSAIISGIVFSLSRIYAIHRSYTK